MKWRHHDGETKLIFIEVVKEGSIVLAMVKPETTVEDVLLSTGLVEYRLGFLPKGPYMMGSEKLFRRVGHRDMLVAVYYAD